MEKGPTGNRVGLHKSSGLVHGTGQFYHVSQSTTTTVRLGVVHPAETDSLMERSNPGSFKSGQSCSCEDTVPSSLVPEHVRTPVAMLHERYDSVVKEPKAIG